jgi:hypothetical protein
MEADFQPFPPLTAPDPLSLCQQTRYRLRTVTSNRCIMGRNHDHGTAEGGRSGSGLSRPIRQPVNCAGQVAESASRTNPSGC